MGWFPPFMAYGSPASPTSTRYGFHDHASESFSFRSHVCPLQNSLGPKTAYSLSRVVIVVVVVVLVVVVVVVIVVVVFVILAWLRRHIRRQHCFLL